MLTQYVNSKTPLDVCEQISDLFLRPMICAFGKKIDVQTGKRLLDESPISRIANLALAIILFPVTLSGVALRLLSVTHWREEAKKQTLDPISAIHNQFTIQGGHECGASACTPTSICAAATLLAVTGRDMVTPAILDDILIRGNALYRGTNSHGQEHLNITEITLPETISLHGKMLWGSWSDRVDRKFYPLKSPQELVDASLEKGIKTPFALVITKTPETICLVVRSPTEFWIFDSHGGGENNGAVLKAFGAQEEVKNALNERFFVEKDLRDDPDYCNFQAAIFVQKER